MIIVSSMTLLRVISLSKLGGYGSTEPMPFDLPVRKRSCRNAAAYDGNASCDTFGHNRLRGCRRNYLGKVSAGCAGQSSGTGADIVALTATAAASSSASAASASAAEADGAVEVSHRNFVVTRHFHVFLPVAGRMCYRRRYCCLPGFPARRLNRVREAEPFPHPLSPRPHQDKSETGIGASSARNNSPTCWGCPAHRPGGTSLPVAPTTRLGSASRTGTWPLAPSDRCHN